MVKLLQMRIRGFALHEMIVTLILCLVIVSILVKAPDMYGYLVLRSTSMNIVRNLSSCKSIASVASNRVAVLTFRPTDAAYSSYHVSSGTDEVQSVKLLGGTRIINTNGFIRNHTLRVNVSGDFVDETGREIISPNPGILTLINDSTDRISIIRIYPTTGQVKM